MDEYTRSLLNELVEEKISDLNRECSYEPDDEDLAELLFDHILLREELKESYGLI